MSRFVDWFSVCVILNHCYLHKWHWQKLIINGKVDIDVYDPCDSAHNLLLYSAGFAQMQNLNFSPRRCDLLQIYYTQAGSSQARPQSHLPLLSAACDPWASTPKHPTKRQGKTRSPTQNSLSNFDARGYFLILGCRFRTCRTAFAKRRLASWVPRSRPLTWLWPKCGLSRCLLARVSQ